MMPSYMPMQDLTRQQNVSGVPPMFQNIANQQAMQNMAMQQGQGLTQQAGQIGQQGGGMNPLVMAMMLRKGDKSQGSSNLGARFNMAFNSQASPYLQNQVSQLGSSTSNPFSNYNMGTGGWGNYGE